MAQPVVVLADADGVATALLPRAPGSSRPAPAAGRRASARCPGPRRAARRRQSGRRWRSPRRTRGSRPPRRRRGRPRRGPGRLRRRAPRRPVRSRTPAPPTAWRPARWPRRAAAPAWADRGAARRPRPARPRRRSRSAWSATNWSRHPGLQNQWSAPSTTACGVSGPNVTVIPQTGSTACRGRVDGLASGGRRESLEPDAGAPPRPGSTARSRVPCVRRCRGRRGCAPGGARCSVRSSSASSASPRVWLQTTPTKPTPASSAARIAAARHRRGWRRPPRRRRRAGRPRWRGRRRSPAWARGWRRPRRSGTTRRGRATGDGSSGSR